MPKKYDNPYSHRAVFGTQASIDLNPKYKDWKHITKIGNRDNNGMYGSWDIEVLPDCPLDLKTRLAMQGTRHSITYL